MDDALYGVRYFCRRLCPECQAYKWAEEPDTESIRCLECNTSQPL